MADPVIPQNVAPPDDEETLISDHADPQFHGINGPGIDLTQPDPIVNQSPAASPSTSSSPSTQVPLVGNSVAAVPASFLSAPASPFSSSTSSTVAVNADMRVRLAALNPAAVYQTSPIMSILNQTGGMLFPYTPTITVNQSVDYMSLQLVHSNTDYQAYTRTPSVKITVSGKFTVQNIREGQYAFAVIHFLRTVSKSYFGEKDAQSAASIQNALSSLVSPPPYTGGNAGLPPPVLLFSGYGDLMFNRLRVILTSHSYTFDEQMDTVAIPIGGTLGGSTSLASLLGGNVAGGIVRLPAMFTIACDLTVIQTPKRMRTEFSFNDFANGTLLNSPDGGWI